MSANTLPAPLRNPEDAAFWDAATDGRLLVPRCLACGLTHWYPRPVCPFCQGNTRWEEHDRRATIYSFTVVQKSPRGPFALGYVEFADGLRMYGGFAASDHGKLRIDAVVEVVFTVAADGSELPLFRLIGSGDAGGSDTDSRDIEYYAGEKAP